MSEEMDNEEDLIDSLRDLACSEKLQEDSCHAIEEEEEEENVN